MSRFTCVFCCFAVFAGVAVESDECLSLLQTDLTQKRHRFWPFTSLSSHSTPEPSADLNIPANETVETATVEIYYETLCPYSLQFLNETLRAAWEDDNLTARMNVNLYPYGNAQRVPESMISEGYHFWHEDARYPITICQHDTSECSGNLVQACAIDILKDQRKSVPYVICMASYGTSTGWEKSSYACGQEIGLDMEEVKICVNSDWGSKLIAHAGTVTQTAFSKFNASGVPFIVVQGNSTVNSTLFEPVCSWLKEPRPSVCTKYADKKKEPDSGCGGGEGSLC